MTRAPTATSSRPNRKPHFDVPDLKGFMPGKWFDYLSQQHGVDRSRMDGRHGPCWNPYCPGGPGTDRARFYGDSAETGGAHCNQCGLGSDGIAHVQKLMGCDFKTALNAIGDWAIAAGYTARGDVKPSPKSQRRAAGVVTAKAAEKFANNRRMLAPEPFDAKKPLHQALAIYYCKQKPGILPRLCAFEGTEFGKFIGNPVLSCPTFRNASPEGQVHAAMLVRVDGQKFPAYGDTVAERKIHLMMPRGSGDSWFFVGGPKHFTASKYVIVCEGPTDSLAVAGILPKEWAAVTNACGAKETVGGQNYWLSSGGPDPSIFAGREVIVVADNDKSGQGLRSAKLKAAAFARFTKPVSLVQLPPEFKDLRDWLATGRSWDDFQNIFFSAAEEIEPESQGLPEKGIPTASAATPKLVDEYGFPLNNSNTPNNSTVTAAVTVLPDEEFVRYLTDFDLSDIGNAKHFELRTRGELLYCHEWKKWLAWNGTRWVLDAGQHSLQRAKETIEELFLLAARVQSQDAFRFAKASSDLGRIRAMMVLASPELAVEIDELDQDPWALNCENGTLDLVSGKLRPHSPADKITKLAPTAYCPDAPAPVWEQFLRDVFVLESSTVDGKRLADEKLTADVEMIQFVQRLFGYCITGDVREQKLPIFHGSGANGKSTLLNAIIETLGPDYCMQCLPDFLMEKRGESHPTEKASLFGKRFVSCVETDASRKLAESTVKLLTGGEKIMARRMREDFWEFAPTHKIGLCTNHKPIITGTDHGIWRRILLIPFSRRFEGADQDKRLPEKLRAEACGILAWIVRGCTEWQRVGLNPPKSVTAATGEYRNSEDVFGRFLADCCTIESATGVRFSSLYERFESWCRDNGDEVIGKKPLGTYLKESGFKDYSANGRCYRGLSLKPE